MSTLLSPEDLSIEPPVPESPPSSDLSARPSRRSPVDDRLGNCAKDCFDQQDGRPADDLDRDGGRERSARDLDAFLRAIARRWRWATADRDDASQEAWLVLLARIRQFRADGERGGFPAWASVVVRNHLANLAHHAAGRPEVPLHPDEVGALIGREVDPAEICERIGTCAAVRAALEEARLRLPEASYQIVILRWFEGRTTPEIAAALGLSQAQVRDRHRRALPILRVFLGRWAESGPAAIVDRVPHADGQDLGTGEVTP
jgi:RNA polymerase sigma factor (sigma-70 family)